MAKKRAVVIIAIYKKNLNLCSIEIQLMRSSLFSFLLGSIPNLCICFCEYMNFHLKLMVLYCIRECESMDCIVWLLQFFYGYAHLIHTPAPHNHTNRRVDKLAFGLSSFILEIKFTMVVRQSLWYL